MLFLLIFSLSSHFFRKFLSFSHLLSALSSLFGGGLGWLNRWWLGVVDSVVAWGGCWVCAAEIGLGWWVCVGFVDSVGLGLCVGGFGSLPRPGVVESVAWGSCWVCAAEIGLGWWVCAGFGSLPRLTTGGFGSLRWWVWVFVGFVVVNS